MARLWEILKGLAGFVGLVAVLLALVIVALIMIFPDWAGIPPLVRILLALVVVGLLGLAVSFPIVFRADVGAKDEHKNERRIRRVILYSYSFAALSLAGSVLPFFVYPSLVPKLYDVMLKSPVGIVLGCSETERAKEEAKETAQEKPKPSAKPGQAKEQAQGAVDQGPAQPSPKSDKVRAEIDCSQDSYQWVVNIGGMTLAPKDSKDGSLSQEVPDKKPPWWPRARIQGGLVVPLYFIVLSLIGAAISLTRRVPEYHRRYSIHYVPTPDKPRLDRAAVREYLTFQVVQFLSAPLLAVVAYYLIAPESRAGLIALGFTAGFSSEAILLLIRSLVEKISPTREAGPQTGAVSGNVVQGGKPVDKATVTVGKTNLKTETDPNGLFVIHGVAVGTREIEGSHGGQSKTLQVTIEAGKTTVCRIQLP